MDRHNSLEPSAKLLLRHASQNSLDESSQRNPSNSPEEDDFKPQYKNPEHFEKAFTTMDTLRKTLVMCDVALVAGDLQIPAHRIVLMSASSYFYAMFTSFEEKDKDRVNILGVDPSALQMLVTYCYTGQINITEETVQTLLPASNLLQLSDVKEACSEFLKNQLHPSNCLGIRGFADLHGCLDLQNTADQFIQFNFSEVCEGEEFLSLTAQQVAILVASDKLTVPNEEKVFEAVLNWINHEPENRKENVCELMELVRFPLLSREYLVNRVDSEPLLSLSPKCKDLLIEALKFHLLKAEQKHLSFTSPRTRPRQSIANPKVLIVVGGQAPKAIRCVEAHSFKEERWRLISDMPTRRCRAGLAVLHGKIYCIGGFNGSLRIKTVDIFDPVTGNWNSGTPLNFRRSTLGVAVLQNRILAIGGFDGGNGLASAEAYDPVTNEWTNIAQMSVRRSSVGVGVVLDRCYALGGYDGLNRQCLSSVECYNPELDVWVKVADMLSRRSGAAVGVLDNLLYSIGGHEGPVIRKSVECYDPTTNQWKYVADMTTCRRNAGCVSYNGYIYVIGGDDGSSNLASVEVYCPKTDTWTPLNSTMVVGRSYCGVAICDQPVTYQ